VRLRDKIRLWLGKRGKLLFLSREDYVQAYKAVFNKRMEAAEFKQNFRYDIHSALDPVCHFYHKATYFEEYEAAAYARILRNAKERVMNALDEYISVCDEFIDYLQKMMDEVK
jgi:hypothetical protein